MLRKQLISKYHLKQNQALHDAPRSYGGSSGKWADRVKNLFYSYYIETVLDYGCGEGCLEKGVFRNWKLRGGSVPTKHGIKWENYDPAIKAKSIIQEGNYDLVVCTDVLEHVEPEKLDNVLKHILSLAGVCVFFVIALNEANKSYPDGRNTHLILESTQWWIDKIKTKTNWRVVEQSSPRPHKDLILEVSP